MSHCRRIDFGNLDAWELEAGPYRVQVLASLGGALQGLWLRGQSCLWGYETPEEALAKHLQEYRGAKLSPVPNRTRAGQFRYRGTDYQMPINFPHGQHQIHGFLAGVPFEAGEEGGALRLLHRYRGDYPGFPFPYDVEVVYSVDETAGMRCATRVRNAGDGPMPIGDGWHPYFRLPHGKADDWVLQLPPARMIPVDADMIPTGEWGKGADFRAPRLLGDAHFDDCMGLMVAGGLASARLFDPVSGIGIEVWQQSGEQQYEYVQVYTPEGRNSVAIEPMTCPPNALATGWGLLELGPGEEASFAWGVRAWKGPAA
jgi:aldose 1-epimerase